MYKLYRVSLNIRSLTKLGIPKLSGPYFGKEGIIIIIIITSIEFPFGGSSPYTSTDKTNKNKGLKRNNTKTQYKQYKTQ